MTGLMGTIKLVISDKHLELSFCGGRGRQDPSCSEINEGLQLVEESGGAMCKERHTFSSKTIQAAKGDEDSYLFQAFSQYTQPLLRG